MTNAHLLALMGATTLAGLPGLAGAQEEGVAPGAADGVDEIVVTGSRIARSELEAPQPVQAVTETDILLSGDVNVVDIVDDLPALIGSEGLGQNTGAGTLGAATLNLRNLGDERTLVLVNGRRHVAGSGAVDVNTIPAALVQTVEVLTGGASAVYGADAVTGVVNFVMRDDFDGADLRAQGSVTDESDGWNGYVSGTLGRNFSGGAGNVALNLTYERQENVRYGDRDFAAGDRTGTDWPNPVRFVQPGDVDLLGLDRVALGDPILGYCGDDGLSAAALDRCDEARGSPARAILPFPRFNLTSYGSLIGVDFFGDGFLTFYPAIR